MKKFIAVIALLATSSFAQERTFDFEAQVGCINQGPRATCVVVNTFGDPITCKVSTTAKTSRRVVIGNTRIVTIPAKMYNDSFKVFAAQGDKIESVSGHADCKAGS